MQRITLRKFRSIFAAIVAASTAATTALATDYTINSLAELQAFIASTPTEHRDASAIFRVRNSVARAGAGVVG